MIRYLLSLSLLLGGLAQATVSWSCSCVWQGPFSTVYKNADLVVSGKISASKGNSVDLQIEQILVGKEYLPDIRIWMQTADLCRPAVEFFPVDSRWVMALKKIKEDLSGSFNPNTPNISYGRLADYSLSKCGGYWLQLNDNLVSGNLTGGTRWEMNPKMTPVLLDLLVEYIAGNMSFEKLTEAARESTIPRELMQNTKSFLRQQ